MKPDFSELKDLNVRARECLRTGVAYHATWFERGVSIIAGLKAPDSYSHEDVVHVIEARRRFADLADRRGNLDLGVKLIGDHLSWVKAQIHYETPVRDSGRLVELLWYVVVHSLIRHRNGQIAEALATVQEAQRHVRRLESDCFDLRHRISLALGRHLQSLATSEALHNAEIFGACEKLPTYTLQN